MGHVVWDDEIAVPILFERGKYQTELWMSLTPNEIMTLRPGTKLAKGHTVVTGLGMGWQLCEVLRKKTVKKVTLVEISQELHDWIGPRIKRMVTSDEWSKLTVEIGDVHKVLPGVKADVALLDHFPGYGHNGFEARALMSRCPGIPKWWAWGSAGLA